MRNLLRVGMTLVTVLLLFFSCQPDQPEKYERPDWLSGKLYTQITSTEGLDSFAIALNLSGYDTIIDASGSFTVFAPTNEAFNAYFNNHPEYTAVSDIPGRALDGIVKYHVVQNPWTLAQLQSLDINGWIDKDDPVNNEPRGYKRQTVLQEDNSKYWVNVISGEESITDSSQANDYRMVYRASRKYVPLFFDAFLDVADIEPNDYEYYFNSTYSPGTMHYAGSRVISEEIFAENGVVYRIDELVEPLANAEQLLKQEHPDYSYSDFLKTIYRYARFTENPEATARQPGYDQGLDVDDLYDLTFPGLTFNIQSELTGTVTSNETYTIRYHHGVIAPTDQALDKLFREVITEESGYPHWPDRNSVPESIYQIIVNAHMSDEPVYFSDLGGEIVNGMNDRVTVDPENIIQKSYASNSTFLGVDEAIVPRAFSSVTGPVYLRPGYSILRSALERANVMPAIKKQGVNYSFLITPDGTVSQDSSLQVVTGDNYPDGYIIQSYDRSAEAFVTRNQSDLMTHFFNHIGTEVPTGAPSKEFIPNLAGNYIVFDNAENLVTGGLSSTYGYNGDSTIFLTPEVLDEPTDNGTTYRIEGFLSFPETGMYSLLTSYPDFAQLLGEAGFIDSVYYTLNEIVDGEKYTVFVPSSEAIANSGLDTLSRSELRQVMRYHFIKGDILFTDGRQSSGDYPTLRVDESSTIYQTNYTAIKVDAKTDLLEILNDDGSSYYPVAENGDSTNIMFSEDLDPHPQRTNFVTKGVVHIIDTVLVHSSMAE